MNFIMKEFGLADELEPISQAHGKKYIAKAKWGEVVILPFYHPAVALYNGSSRATLTADFKTLKKFIQ